jgi:hypothetical protein
MTKQNDFIHFDTLFPKPDVFFVDYSLQLYENSVSHFGGMQWEDPKEMTGGNRGPVRDQKVSTWLRKTQRPPDQGGLIA